MNLNITVIRHPIMPSSQVLLVLYVCEKRSSPLLTVIFLLAHCGIQDSATNGSVSIFVVLCRFVNSFFRAPQGFRSLLACTGITQRCEHIRTTVTFQPTKLESG